MRIKNAGNRFIQLFAADHVKLTCFQVFLPDHTSPLYIYAY
nr:MAG TPA: hypothetical protein [Caudoviricetes sp.]